MLVLRRSIAFVLLLLVGFPLIAFVLFHFQQQKIRVEVKAAFKSKELSTIHIRQLKWHKKNKELIVNGTLFDVNTISKQPDGSFIVKGLYDYQEQKLHKLLEKKTEENQKSPLLILYTSCFISNQFGDSFTVVNCSAPLSKKKGAYFETLLSQYQLGILGPPPKSRLFFS